MCTKTLSYLQCKLLLKSLLLAFFSAMFLSACGIKGPLYQTPAQPSPAKVDTQEQSSDTQALSDNKKIAPAITQSTEQGTESQ